MTRLLAISCCIAFAACSSSSARLQDSLPQSVDGAALQQARDEPNENAPAPIRSMGLKRWLIATYDRGGTPVKVRLYEMNVEASAFELIQKWRQSEGIAVYKGPYFVVVESKLPQPTDLNGFAQALQTGLK